MRDVHIPFLQSHSRASKVPANGLSKKVDAMIECANRRQAADAIAIYAEMRAKDDTDLKFLLSFLLCFLSPQRHIAT